MGLDVFDWMQHDLKEISKKGFAFVNQKLTKEEINLVLLFIRLGKEKQK